MVPLILELGMGAGAAGRDRRGLVITVRSTQRIFDRNRIALKKAVHAAKRAVRTWPRPASA